MDDNELRAWLDRVAAQRLKGRPELLGQFRHAMSGLSGTLMMTRAHALIPMMARHGVEMGHAGSIELVQEHLTSVVDWFIKHRAQPAPAIAPLQESKHVPPGETAEQRQARRYQACIDAGLTLPDNDYAALPRGIGEVAKKEGIKRQSFAEDVKAHIRRLHAL